VSLLRFHLPTYSPLSLESILGAAARPGADAVARLEDLLRREYAAERAVLCGSGAEALQLGLGLLGRRAGGQPVVAVPAFTCFEVATAAVGSGVRVALYDVDPATLAPDPDSLRQVLAAGATGAVVSPLFGVPVDWDALRAIADEHGAALLEDAAQGHGAAWAGRPLGTLGEASVLSFGRGKGWSGIRGGALLLRGGLAAAAAGEPGRAGAGAEASVALAALAQWALGRPAVYRLPRSLPFLGLGRTSYHDPVPPRRMARVAAALATLSREAAGREAAVRRENARAYLEGLPRNPLVQPVVPPAGATPGYLRLPLRTRFGISGFPTRPTRLGVEASYPRILADLPALRPRLENAIGRWPGAEELTQRLVTLPTHSRLRPAEREQVLALVRQYGG
jgi:perosamine synthetase